jgi:hypothetical protein
MAKPNKIFSRSPKAFVPMFVTVKDTEGEAQQVAKEIRESKAYDRVRVTRFRSGSRKERLYAYAVRGYVKK